MWECYCCGRLFSRPARSEEARGECFGFPAREDGRGCPYCGGGFGEAPPAPEPVTERGNR